MSKNTKKETYKEYLRLLTRQHEINLAQKNLGYVELEKPIHHGYLCHFELREDIQRQTDGPILAKLLENYSTIEWSRTKDFILRRKKRTHLIEPKLKKLEVREYEKLDEKTKGFFRETWEKGWFEYRKCYVLDFPRYYLVIKKKKDYITHQKVIDGTLEAEDQFIDDRILQIMYISSPYDDGSMKPFAKVKNKGERRNNKMILKSNIQKQIEDLETGLTYQHKNSAKWERW